MLKLKAYTDGSCLGNPGVGGFGAILLAKGKERTIRGHCTTVTTNNRMELQAVISVIDWCNEIQKTPCDIEVYTDSQYIMNLSKQSRASLTSASRKKNDLWLELIQKGLAGKHHITFIKVRGHSDDELNNRVDKIARAEAMKASGGNYGKTLHE